MQLLKDIFHHYQHIFKFHQYSMSINHHFLMTLAMTFLLLINLNLQVLVSCQKHQRIINYQSGCRMNEVMSPIGCIKSCSSPQFNTCPEFFPLLFDPKFCAYSKFGQWIDYTFECQACTNPEVLGVVPEKCSCQFLGCDNCQVCEGDTCVQAEYLQLQCDAKDCLAFDQRDKCNRIICPYGKVCIDGKCKDIDKCSLVRCGKGSYCQNGQCIKIEKCQCKQYEFCVGNKCIDKCARILCGENELCQKGRCFLKDLCENIKCEQEHYCAFGKCYKVNKKHILSGESSIKQFKPAQFKDFNQKIRPFDNKFQDQKIEYLTSETPIKFDPQSIDLLKSKRAQKKSINNQQNLQKLDYLVEDVIDQHK